jgi:hypothetical protein
MRTIRMACATQTHELIKLYTATENDMCTPKKQFTYANTAHLKLPCWSHGHELCRMNLQMRKQSTNWSPSFQTST